LLLFLVMFWQAANAFAATPRPVAWSSNRVTGSPNPPSAYTVERLFPHLTLENPIDLAFLPDRSRLFIADQKARLWSFDPRQPNDQPTLVLDVLRHRKRIDNILALAFHPGFATNHFVFLNYNQQGGVTNGARVSRFTLSPDNTSIDPATERLIVSWYSGGHNGCTLLFGNDGFLYISTGDTADPDPPDGKFKTGQDLGDLLASVLRIDVDHSQGTNAYAIPRDNPFVDTPGARPEVWAFGFRNPYRMSLDRVTGDLWLGDVGWEQWEMIYRVRRGGNYGWPITEGPNTRVRSDIAQGPGPILPPLIALPHSEAASITGGVVYRGRRLPKLHGAYLYGDWETGKFWALRQEGDRLISNEELCDTALKPVSFTLDPEGEFIILDYNGGLYRFTPNTVAAANQSFPRKLSETGLFTTIQPLVPAPGTASYNVVAPMWNDHAFAQRLLAIPDRDSIITSGGVGNIAGATWLFPSNTVLARTLSLEMKAGDPASARRIETQLLHWDGQGWNPYSYRWAANQTDAELVGNEGANDTFSVTDPRAPGGSRKTPWRFMSRAECLRCHNAWAGDALTMNWLQLGSAADPRSELQRLASLGLITVQKPPREMHVLVNPHDEAAPLNDRARSWLHVNCATCHRFGAGGNAAVRFNYDLSLAEFRAVDVRAARGEFDLKGAKIVAPGDPYRSTLYYRISTERAGRMPHIGSRLVDLEGTQLVRDWIQELAGVRRGPKRLAELRNPSQTLASMNGALSLLDFLTTEGLKPMTNGTEAAGYSRVRSESVVSAASHTNALVRDLLQHLLPADQRRQTLGADIQPETILSLTGNRNRGRELFAGASQCARCHVCEAVGRPFGPMLTGISRKYSRPQLLEHILQPSKEIAPEFRTVSVTLADNTELTGFVIQRGPSGLILRDETLTDHMLKLGSLKESRNLALSAMPEGLLAPLTAQEAADLLEHLLQSR
jgi:putative heme-binding domain-containing protein